MTLQTIALWVGTKQGAALQRRPILLSSNQISKIIFSKDCGESESSDSFVLTNLYVLSELSRRGGLQYDGKLVSH